MFTHAGTHTRAHAGTHPTGPGLALTLCACPEAAENPEQGGLARARVARDEQALPLRDLQAQILD